MQKAQSLVRNKQPIKNRMRLLTSAIFFLSCDLLLYKVLGAEHPFNVLDSEQELVFKSTTEVVRTSYHLNETSFNTQSKYLKDIGYEPIARYTRSDGGWDMGWYNTQTNHLIICHTVPLLCIPGALFAHYGIIDAVVREELGNLDSEPNHEDICTMLISVAQKHISAFRKDPRFIVSSLNTKEKQIVDTELNFNLFHDSTLQLCRVTGSLVGVSAMAMCEIMSSFLKRRSIYSTYVEPYVQTAGLTVGYVAGGKIGEAKGKQIVDKYLSQGRTVLAQSLDTMYRNALELIKTTTLRNNNNDDFTITITGHSFGAVGALGVATRLEHMGHYPQINVALFNSPGGHEGLVKIWNQKSQLPNIPATLSVDVSHIKRSSCIVSSFGTVPANQTYTFAPLKNDDIFNQEILDWQRTLQPAHSIEVLANDIFRNSAKR
jgi:hypothetical protein